MKKIDFIVTPLGQVKVTNCGGFTLNSTDQKLNFYELSQFLKAFCEANGIEAEIKIIKN